MTIRKRGERWPVEVYDPAVKSRKRYVGTFDTQAEAREAKRLAEKDVARRRGKRGNETVADWAARWLELRPRQKESTNIAYREQVAIRARTWRDAAPRGECRTGARMDG
jgi:hypothetical protein